MSNAINANSLVAATLLDAQIGQQRYNQVLRDANFELGKTQLETAKIFKQLARTEKRLEKEAAMVNLAVTAASTAVSVGMKAEGWEREWNHAQTPEANRVEYTEQQRIKDWVDVPEPRGLDKAKDLFDQAMNATSTANGIVQEDAKVSDMMMEEGAKALESTEESWQAVNDNILEAAEEERNITKLMLQVGKYFNTSA